MQAFSGFCQFLAPLGLSEHPLLVLWSIAAVLPTLGLVAYFFRKV